MASQRKSLFAAIYKTVNPNYLSFLAGIIVSTAINIYTNMLWAGKSQQSTGVVVSSILLIASALLITSISLNLQTMRDTVAQSPQFLASEDRESIHTKMVLKSRAPLIALTFLAIITAIGGLLMLKWSLEPGGYVVTPSIMISPLK